MTLLWIGVTLDSDVFRNSDNGVVACNKCVLKVEQIGIKRRQFHHDNGLGKGSDAGQDRRVTLD